MITYKITLDDTPKAKLLIEMLKEMAFVKSVEPSFKAEADTYVTSGELMRFDDFADMILTAEKQIREGKTHSSDDVRQLLKK